MLENLGKALGLIMRFRGISQSDLARAAKVGKSQISKYLAGKELPKLDSLERLAQELGVGFVEIFTLMDWLDRLRNGLEAHDLSSLGRSSSPLMPPALEESLDRISLDLLHLQRAYLAAVVRLREEPER